MSSNISIDYSEDNKNTTNSIVFDIKGDQENGLNKSIINGIRRVLLSSIPSIAFRTDMEHTDIKIIKNTTPLHNEIILHRISMIPLFINPNIYKRNLLFKLNVNASSDQPITKITSEDFDIFPLNDDITIEEEINDIDLHHFSDTPISKEDKDKILRPFNGSYYTDITELKSNNSDIDQSIELYGIPRISYAYEDARWQAVSMSTFSFKKDEDLFKKIINEKIKINNIKEEDKYNYVKSLSISEAERHFHRDKYCEPYWYTFKIDSVHYHSAKDLFIQANELLIQQLELFKKNIQNISSEESRISFNKINENIYSIHVQGNDDTIGNIIQSHISKNNVDDIIVCGYKKPHPLEKIIEFNISMNTTNHSDEQNIIKILDIFTSTCNEIIIILSNIISESNNKL